MTEQARSARTTTGAGGGRTTIKTADRPLPPTQLFPSPLTTSVACLLLKRHCHNKEPTYPSFYRKRGHGLLTQMVASLHQGHCGMSRGILLEKILWRRRRSLKITLVA